ncbi:MAG: hypothetical protein FK730_14105 [Asgard group archaeon]|nr:hypothetical protein [Asgard group archaeon]
MTIPGSFLTNPIPLKVYDENEEEGLVALTFSKPINKQISLIIVGKITDAVIERIDMDLTVGISLGYLNHLNDKNQKDPKSVFIKSFLFQEYGFAYKEVIEYGIGIGIACMNNIYIREALSSVISNDAIDWALESKFSLVKAKEGEYDGDVVLAFWEKENDGNWVIPSEAVKIWQNILYNDTDAGEKLVNELHKAFKKNKKKDIVKISEEIETLLVKGE